MKITVNNEAMEIAEGTSLATLLSTTGTSGGGCQAGGTAVAVNDEFAPRSSWPEHILSEGDKVLIIKAAYGG